MCEEGVRLAAKRTPTQRGEARELLGCRVGIHAATVTSSGGERSSPLNISDLQSPAGSPFSCSAGATCGQRQIGYLWAPNWSLTYALLGPLYI
jgi:hypothetical protein